MIIQVIGLPGAGKTTLAIALQKKIGGIHLNADEFRAGLCSDLGFDTADRIEQARRMGEVARLLDKQGHKVIADFVCPTEETRQAFGTPDWLIWVDRIKTSRYEDTNLLWESPLGRVDLHIPAGWSVEKEVKYVIGSLGL
jgi:cytidylate kinase